MMKHGQTQPQRLQIHCTFEAALPFRDFMFRNLFTLAKLLVNPTVNFTPHVGCKQRSVRVLFYWKGNWPKNACRICPRLHSCQVQGLAISKLHGSTTCSVDYLYISELSFYIELGNSGPEKCLLLCSYVGPSFKYVLSCV